MTSSAGWLTFIEVCHRRSYSPQTRWIALYIVSAVSGRGSRFQYDGQYWGMTSSAGWLTSFVEACHRRRISPNHTQLSIISSYKVHFCVKCMFFKRFAHLSFFGRLQQLASRGNRAAKSRGFRETYRDLLQRYDGPYPPAQYSRKNLKRNKL